MPAFRTLACLPALLALGACATTPPGAEATRVDVRVAVPAITRPVGETAPWWYRDGAAQAAARGAMAGRARNVVLFVGDGMSLTTVTAARILAGQRAGRPGEEHRLAWEHFDATALVRTYNTDAQTPDSAGTMTAMASGYKTRAGVLGVGPEVARGDCAASLRAPRHASLWELAAAEGLSTGVVTTTRVTHATPAATFAHLPERNWENDTDLTPAAREAGCVDIARQLVEGPHVPDVLLGGGRGMFATVEQADPEHAGTAGLRRDGRDLVKAWQSRKPGGAYVWNAAQLAAAPADAPLLGLFEPSHMRYDHDRPADPGGEPSLAEMTRAAITRLARDPDGYVLLVEAGRIDHAHHLGNAHRALVDTLALSDAVAAAVELAGPDTLIVVTADHSHTLSFAGYPARGNAILGKVRGGSGEDIDPETLARDALGLPYTTLSYANGPGYTGASAQQPEGPKTFEHPGKGYRAARSGRPDLTHVDTEHPDYLQEATVPLSNESHGGDDVGAWATGPGSAAVRGSIEQNALHHVMLQAMPRLRAAACRRGLCDGNGVPVQPLPLD